MNFDDYFDFLNLISPIEKVDFSLLSDHIKERHFKKNEIVIRPGEIQQHCYFLLEGVMMSYSDNDTKIHVQAFAYPPGMAAIPESFILQKPSDHFLQCMSDTRVAEISHTALQDALKKSHPLETMLRKMTEHLLIGVLARNTEIHSLNMEQRFRAFTKRSPHLLQLVPHKYLASYLNIDPTNFSKLYNSVVI